MSYVQHVLREGEEVRYIASIHWITYLPGTLLLLAALGIWVFAERVQSGRTVLLVLAAAVCLIAVGHLFWAWFSWWTTEIAVTNRRVISKTGFIRRDTNEMQMDKVESVEVKQSILGRVLDYGTIIVRGTGTGLEPLRLIAAPIELRNHITGS